MLDLKWIRENPEAFDAAMKRRGLPPQSEGLLSLDADKRPLEAMRWGLCHQYDASWQWQYIRRFESYQPFAP